MSKMELRIRGTNAERRMIYLLMKDDLLPFAIDCEGYTVSLAELGIQYTSMKAGYLAWWDQLSKLFPEVYIQPCIVTGKSYTSVELLRFETYAGGMNLKNYSDKNEHVHQAIQQCVKRFLFNTSLAVLLILLCERESVCVLFFRYWQMSLFCQVLLPLR